MLWVVVTAGAIISIYTGNAEPYVSPSALPAGGTPDAGPYLFGLIAAVSFGGLAVARVVTPGRWKRIASETDLTLEDGEFTGTIQGRPVRARQERRKVSGDSRSPNRATFTVVEADLSAPTTESLIVGVTGGDTDLEEMGENLAVESIVVGDRFVMLGDGSEDLVADVLTTRTRDALLAVGGEAVSIGAASEVLMGGMPDMSDSVVGGLLEGSFEKKLDKQFGGTPTTVAIDTKGLVSDPDELDRRAEAVAAVADAFEAATTESAGH